MDAQLDTRKGFAKGLGNAPCESVCSVLKYSNPAEILELCMSSNHVLQCAQTIKPKLKELKWKVLSPGYYLLFLTPEYVPEKISILRVVTHPIEGKLLENPFHVEARRKKNTVWFKCNSNSLEAKHDLYIKLSKFIMNLFDIKEYFMDTNIVSDILTFHGETFNTFLMFCPRLTGEELRLILEDITVDNFFLDAASTIEPTRFLLKHRSMVISKADWLAPNFLMDERCKSLLIGVFTTWPRNMRHDVTPMRIDFVHIFGFINAWYAGKNTLAEKSEIAFGVKDFPSGERIFHERRLSGYFAQKYINRNTVINKGIYTVKRRDGAKMEISSCSERILLKIIESGRP